MMVRRKGREEEVQMDKVERVDSASDVIKVEKNREIPDLVWGRYSATW